MAQAARHRALCRQGNRRVNVQRRADAFMSSKPKYRDWYAHTKTLARIDTAALKRTVPAQWARAIDALAVHDLSLSHWEQDGAWRARIAAFRSLHGDALSWAMCDSDMGCAGGLDGFQQTRCNAIHSPMKK